MSYNKYFNHEEKLEFSQFYFDFKKLMEIW